MRREAGPSDAVAIFEALCNAIERVNGRRTHDRAPPLTDHVWYDEGGNLRTRDEFGDQYVMVQFERPMMEKAAEILARKGGHVLNVGFGCGIVDGEIQRLGVAHHTIVEGHPTVLRHMEETGWMARKNVEVIGERWENVDWWNRAESFDAIYFDPYPYDSDIDDLILWRECVLKSLKPGGILVLYGPSISLDWAEGTARAFRKPMTVSAVEHCTVDVPFVVEEWRKYGVGRHEVPIFVLSRD
jgi:hypothetical protein